MRNDRQRYRYKYNYIDLYQSIVGVSTRGAPGPRLELRTLRSSLFFGILQESNRNIKIYCIFQWLQFVRFKSDLAIIRDVLITRLSPKTSTTKVLQTNFKPKNTGKFIFNNNFILFTVVYETFKHDNYRKYICIYY